MAAPDDLGRWEPLAPAQVARLLAGYAGSWCVAGGWALDLYLGRQTRSHSDIDIELPRQEASALARHLSGWSLSLASNGRLEPWDPRAPVPCNVNSLWGRSEVDGPWRLQILLAATEGADWLYRRDRRVRRRLDDGILTTVDGWPHLAPEIQLLYKSKDPREKDDRDFESVRSRLSEDRRGWLRHALSMSQLGHRWIAALETQGAPD